MALIVKRAKGKSASRARRHFRVRKVVTGTTGRPRLVVSRSSRHVFVQVVDDTVGKTLASASEDRCSQAIDETRMPVRAWMVCPNSCASTVSTTNRARC